MKKNVTEYLGFPHEVDVPIAVLRWNECVLKEDSDVRLDHAPVSLFKHSIQ